MNPFLKWITARRHALAARKHAAPRGATTRQCPNCHRAQSVPAERSAEVVRCDACRAPIPAPERTR